MLPEVSYLAAFLGGLFSLLSPCSALLLPTTFFAYAFESRRELVRKTVVFYLGLCVLTAEGWAGSVSRAVPDALVLALAFSFVAYQRLTRKKKGPGSAPGPDAPERG